MKNLYLLFILSLFFSNLSMAQIKLEIEIENLKNNIGNVLLALLDSEGNQISGKMGQIQNKKSIIRFEDLESGAYAIKYIHDENANGKLDKNFMGIPKEGYGISNNAYGFFGPEEFKKQLFVLRSSSKINLETKY